jgi:hypothetical protein
MRLEAEMRLSSREEETFVTRFSSRPSPEEGRRLIRDFLRVERPDLREEIFKFVAKILRMQEEDKQ